MILCLLVFCMSTCLVFAEEETGSAPAETATESGSSITETETAPASESVPKTETPETGTDAQKGTETKPDEESGKGNKPNGKSGTETKPDPTDKTTNSGTEHEHLWKLLKDQSIPASCEEKGKNCYICEECGKTREETVPAAGHQWGEWKTVKKPTCTEDGAEIRTCANCGKETARVLSKTGEHTWSEWSVTKEATCTTDGTEARICSVCGKQETKTIPKTGEHQWSEWNEQQPATCTNSGVRVRTCEVCGKRENESLAKLPHDWGEWIYTVEPTCTKDGKEERACNFCGTKQKQVHPKLGHDIQEWVVTKEPTCRKNGEREGTCIRCGKTKTEKIPAVDHDYQEWETIEEATDFSKGKRQGICRFCKRKKTEEFYPEGTLAKELENDQEILLALQNELKALGFMKKDPTGEYDRETVNAVKQAEKEMDLKADGVAWPGVLRLLGIIGSGADGITKDPSKYTLQLSIRQTSEVKETYSAGDELTYEWTLKNAARKNPAKKVKVFRFDGKKSDNRKNQQIEDPFTLNAGEEMSGTFVYTVTEEDAAAGRFSHGMIVKGSIGGNAVSSNTVIFVNTSEITPSGEDPAEETNE